MVISIVNVLDCISTRANERLLAVKARNGLALDFVWLGDRFGQRIVAIIDGAETIVATSVETTNRSDADGSHAFQDLSRQTVSDADLIFLVGIANRAYWSASVEVLPSSRGFLWDVSCKPSRAEILTCGFWLALAPRICDLRSLILPLERGWECVIDCEAVSGHETKFELAGPILRTVTPSPVASNKSPVRWKYRMELRRALKEE